MRLKDAWKVTQNAVKDFFQQKVLKLSAALAYYTIFALPGLLIIIIWISELFYGRETVEGSVFHLIQGLVGPRAAADIQLAIRQATESSGGWVATITGLVALVIGATSIFSEIQDSINRIWHLRAKPRKGKGLLKLVLNRLLSFSMIITLGFILLVSLVINGAMDILLDALMSRYPDLTVLLVYLLNLLFTFGIAFLIFAAIFKVLPDARVKWKHVRIGATVTALLFLAGKFLISYYLGNTRMTSAYGAAGSVIGILLWVFYSSAILYFGAVFTHAYVLFRGSRIYPNSYAVWVQQIEVESEHSIQQQPGQKTVVEVPRKPPGG